MTLHRATYDMERIYWAAVFLWAGLVFGADSLVVLPQIGGAGPWSWVFAGAGLLALIGDLYRISTPNWPDPVVRDYVWAGVLLVIGLGGFVSLEIAFPLILVCIGVAIVVNLSTRRE